MSQKTEVKIYDYNECADSFNVTVNDEKKTVTAQHIADCHQVMSANWASEEQDKVPQSDEDYCLAMCYEAHFQEEPQSLCHTFYVCH